MRPRDANGIAQGTTISGEVRAGMAPARPRARLSRSLLESDRTLVLTTALEDVVEILSGPAAIATWFAVTREPTHQHGRVVVGLPHTATVFHGREDWMPEQHAVIFDGDHPAVRGFVTLRSVILPVAGFGTELWVHLEAPPRRGARRHLAILERVVDQGLARIHAELDRSSR